MSECKNGGPNCGKLDCAWGCCWPRDTSAVVPTASVPRVQKDNATVGVFGFSAPGFIRPHDPIAQAVDDYLLMERKARALDDIRRQLQGCGMQVWVDEIDRLVHPAQSSAPADR